MTVLRVALAQLNPTVGDIDGNLAKLLDAYDRADAAGCDVIAFPELSITGYPPEDLVMKPGFVADNEAALGKLAARTRHCAAVVGFVDEDRDLFNAAAVCAEGEVLGTYRKRLLPNYAVFDEARYFTPGNETDPLELYVIGGVKVGISICEDIWSPDGPLSVQADGGAELAININGSPYHRGKAAYREQMLATRAADAHSALVYVNQVGGQDELVFDGCSLAFDAEGNLIARGPQFSEALLIVDVPVPAVYRQRLLDPRGRISQVSLPQIVVSEAPVLHDEPVVNDVVDRCSRRRPSCTRRSCSARVTTAARTASPTSSSALSRRHRLDARRGDRRRRARAPITCTASRCRRATPATTPSPTPPCSPRTSASTTARSPSSRRSPPTSRCSRRRFDGRPPGLTQENIQSRCRGQLLMALSNEFGWMVLTTGNKSEMAVGYFTIYGDSVGGYAVIKDVLKTEVYALCRYVNERAGREIIPEDVITKPPSAELRPDQRDDQSLPPYEVLDPILEAYVEDDRTAGEIVELGLDEAARAAGHPPRRHRRVQAPAVPARRPRHHQGVRSRPADADHQRLPRLRSVCRRRVSPAHRQCLGDGEAPRQALAMTRTRHSMDRATG